MKKKMLSFVSLGLVCIPLFLSCETNHYAEEAQLNSMVEIPKKIISTTKAAKLFQNDHTTRLSVIGKTNTSIEDKAIHFNLNSLKDYIERLETMSIAKNIPITGISFIMGSDADGKRTTFIMPSTRNGKLDYQESFTIENGQFLTFKHIQRFITPKNISVNDENLILSPNGYITYNEASTLFNKYETKYIQPFAAQVTRDYYTKAVWYSLAEIKEYISYLKKKSDQHQLQITGIDVFFGVYDTNPDLELKSNAQTVFLTASSHKKSIINTKNTTLKNLIQNGFSAKDDVSDESEQFTFNEGELSPPPKN
ncbi:hypothetical protein [Kordia sp.]|uniref:hypothetical protein n=1 Tax=Kordia sp. TaxID=1965332 RepID=UPI003B5CCB96